jgi:hypothetical protein
MNSENRELYYECISTYSIEKSLAWDHSVEGTALVMKSLSRLSSSFLAYINEGMDCNDDMMSDL